MTVRIVVAIFDKAIDAFGQPFFVPARGAAMRAFQDELNRPESEPGRHPDDYDLFELASFDDATGRFVNVEPVPARLSTGKTLVVPKEV